MILPSVVNARDLGGLPVKGGFVREGLLLRTAHLADISPEDVRVLTDRYRLRRIFDLRSNPECELQPDRHIPGAEHIILPTLDTEEEKKSGEIVPDEVWLNLNRHIAKLSFTSYFKERARELYPSLVMSEYSQLQYAAFMSLVVETTDGAVLWHCSQGKDRTGVAAALILGALGADKETIIEDFDLSNRTYAPLVEEVSLQVKEMGGGEEELDVVRAFLGVSTRNFTRMLDSVERSWGTLDNYLESRLGIGPRERGILRERYVAG